MNKQITISVVIIILITTFSCKKASLIKPEVITKIEMNLSAFGVESDNFPSITVVLDYLKDTSICIKSYYNPAYKGSEYSLNKTEMSEILNLLNTEDLKKLKPEYSVDFSDQPSSKVVIYTNKREYVINDYGLVGNNPLQKLYKIVYKL